MSLVPPHDPLKVIKDGEDVVLQLAPAEKVYVMLMVTYPGLPAGFVTA
jgi:hypothetical protein